MPKNQIVCGLDIGTSSIKALAGRENLETGEIEVVGVSQFPSFGVRRGVVVNTEEVAKRIQNVISNLEGEIGEEINEVYVNISGSHLFSTFSQGSIVVSRADQRISEEDKTRVLQAAQAFSLPSNKEILKIFPQEFIVDGEGQIKDPVGMEGLKLEARILAICAFSPFLKNLTQAVLEAGLQISDIIPSGLASAQAVLDPQQKELGVCLLDIGGGTTDMVVYEENELVYAKVFPIGSNLITNDIAVGLKTDVEIAEKIKKEFGTCLFKGANKKEKITLPEKFGGEVLMFQMRGLTKIIEARVSEIFGEVAKELKKLSLKTTLPGGVVLTGGGVKLPKIGEVAKKELRLPVRIGKPKKLEGVLGVENDASWSTCFGLLLKGFEEEKGETERSFSGMNKNILKKLKKILKFFIP